MKITVNEVQEKDEKCFSFCTYHFMSVKIVIELSRYKFKIIFLPAKVVEIRIHFEV